MPTVREPVVLAMANDDREGAEATIDIELYAEGSPIVDGFEY